MIAARDLEAAIFLSKTFDEYGYSGLTIPTINATTLDCKVNANVQFDIVLCLRINVLILDVI